MNKLAIIPLLIFFGCSTNEIKEKPCPWDDPSLYSEGEPEQGPNCQKKVEECTKDKIVYGHCEP